MSEYISERNNTDIHHVAIVIAIAGEMIIRDSIDEDMVDHGIKDAEAAMDIMRDHPGEIYDFDSMMSAFDKYLPEKRIMKEAPEVTFNSWEKDYIYKDIMKDVRALATTGTLENKHLMRTLFEDHLMEGS